MSTTRVPRSGLWQQVARAVHFAHQRGILHRDLKPANILLDPDGTPARHRLRPGQADRGRTARLTQSGAIVGTPSYMAPEQARGAKAISTAADVYSLGAMLYELLTGRPPFKGESVAQTLRMVEEQDPTPPRRINPACDPDLESVALKCLEKDPTRRYETAGALADDLRRWQDGDSVSARRTGTSQRAWKWVKRNPAVTGLAAGVLLALIGGTIVSTYYAVLADERSQLAAGNEARAKENEQEALKYAAAAKLSADEAKVRWYRGMYEQMRTARLARAAGSRAEVLRLAADASRLRGEVEAMDPRPADVPTAADLPHRGRRGPASTGCAAAPRNSRDDGDGRAHQPRWPPIGAFVCRAWRGQAGAACASWTWKAATNSGGSKSSWTSTQRASP